MPRWDVASIAVWSAVLLGLLGIAPEIILRAPELNDSVLHEALAEHAARHWNEHWPVDHWFPSIAMGFPVFANYQHLSHLLAAGITQLIPGEISAGDIYQILSLLLLAAIPLAIDVSLRRMGLSRGAAAASAVLYVVLSSEGYYGIGWESYLWRGHGIETQVWGTFLLFLSLGFGWDALRRGRGVYLAGILLAATALSHLIYGYMAALSLSLALLIPNPEATFVRRLTRFAGMVSVTALATAYWVVPFIMNADQILRSRWEPTWKWDSMGWAWVGPRLFSGEIFDGSGFAWRLPIVSILVALGVGWAVFRALRRSDPVARWLLLGFVVWNLLFLGRAQWGQAMDLLPFSSGLHMHRFIGGVQVFGLVLAGLAFEALALILMKRGFVGRAHLRERLAWALPVLVFLIFATPVADRVAYVAANARMVRAARQAVDGARDYHHIVGVLRELPPGRVYAGFAGNWGRTFTVGALPMWALLQGEGFDMVGFLFMAMAKPGEWQMRIDLRNPAHLDVFGARYVVAPAGGLGKEGSKVSPPKYLKVIERTESIVLYETPTTGYFGLGQARPVPENVLDTYAEGDTWERIFRAGESWLYGQGPSQHVYLTFDDSLTLLPPGPKGQLFDPSLGPDTYAVSVRTATVSDVILKVTYHPNWWARVDGQPARIVEVLPGFMAVRLAPGTHRVVFRYEPPAWKRALFALAVAMVLLTPWSSRLERGRRRTQGPDAPVDENPPRPPQSETSAQGRSSSDGEVLHELVGGGRRGRGSAGRPGHG